MQFISKISFDKVTEDSKLARFAKIMIYTEINLYRSFFFQNKHLHPLTFYLLRFQTAKKLAFKFLQS